MELSPHRWMAAALKKVKTTMPKVSYPAKVALVSAGVGVTIIGLLAVYLRRRRGKPYRDRPKPARPDKALNRTSTLERRSRRSLNRSPTTFKNTNGEIPVQRSSSPSVKKQLNLGSSRSTSVSSLPDSASTSTITLTQSQDTSNLNAEQLCDLGLESLQNAIDSWEDALMKLDEIDNLQEQDGGVELHDQLHHLLERAYRIQEYYEQKLFRKISSEAAFGSAMAAISEMDQVYEREERRRKKSLGEESSDQESFVSAIDMVDLADLDAQKESFQHLALYNAGLLEVEHGSVPVRTLRTKMLTCSSDTEFLAKLHCTRLAFELLFKDETLRDWFEETGKQMIGDLLTNADRDPEDFYLAYDEMMSYVKDQSNWPEMEEELRGRGVRVISFFDVVIDFILLDAFDDLESPPSSVITVVQNRWLSNGFKETALSTAVWSVLKAKRRLLKFPKGFIAHFYAISEHVSPVLAWGFLGPPGELKDLCEFFKSLVLGYMQDIFSYTKVRYTTLEHLTDDIIQLARERRHQAADRLS